MRESELAAIEPGSFWDECRSGNSHLLTAVAPCYVQCSLGGSPTGLN